MARNDNAALVEMFAPRFPELKALYDACETRKDVLALRKRIDTQLGGGRWVDGTYQEPETEVPSCIGANEAFAKAARATFNDNVTIVKSGKEMRVAMADRYLSRSNKVGRLR
jgi:hypothetical protein